jgi:hypothetical protein
MHASPSTALRRFAALAAVVVLLLTGCELSVEPVGTPLPTIGRSTDAPPARSPSGEPSADGAFGALTGAWRPGPWPLQGTLPQVDAAGEHCRAAEPAIGQAPAVLTDVRGDHQVLFVFAEASDAWACLATGESSDAGVWVLEPPSEPIGDENLDLLLYGTLTDQTGDVRTVAVGRVGRAGVRVVASFDDESEVEAAKGGGWWTMWWPTDVDAATVAVQDRQSIAIDALPIPRD